MEPSVGVEPTHQTFVAFVPKSLGEDVSFAVHFDYKAALRFYLSLAYAARAYSISFAFMDFDFNDSSYRVAFSLSHEIESSQPHQKYIRHKFYHEYYFVSLPISSAR